MQMAQQAAAHPSCALDPVRWVGRNQQTGYPARGISMAFPVSGKGVRRVLGVVAFVDALVMCVDG